MAYPTAVSAAASRCASGSTLIDSEPPSGEAAVGAAVGAAASATAATDTGHSACSDDTPLCLLLKSAPATLVPAVGAGTGACAFTMHPLSCLSKLFSVSSFFRRRCKARRCSARASTCVLHTATTQHDIPSLPHTPPPSQSLLSSSSPPPPPPQMPSLFAKGKRGVSEEEEEEEEERK